MGSPWELGPGWGPLSPSATPHCPLEQDEGLEEAVGGSLSPC